MTDALLPASALNAPPISLHFPHAEAALPRRVAVGWERRVDASYSWRGLQRPDGPICIWQYTLSGRGVLERQGRRHEVGPGQAFMVTVPDDHHYYLPDGWAPWEFVYLYFDGGDALYHANWLIRHHGVIYRYPLDHPILRMIGELGWAIHAGQITTIEPAADYVYRVMMALRRDATPPAQCPSPACLRAMQFAARHYDEEIGVDDLARASGLSRAHFSRRFTRELGVGPQQYLRDIRLQRAQTLLRGTTHSLEAVATQCGFAGASYFGKVFRHAFGITPAEYRAGGHA